MQMANKVTLKNIASFSKGEQINGDLLLKDGAYPYLNGGINPSGMWNECNVDGNTVTISEGGNSCGYVNYMDSPFWCGAHCYYLYDVKCDIKFLYHALKSSQDRLMSLRSGACMPNIKKKDLGEFEIPEPPPLAIQREIAYNLDKVSEAIEQCRKILDKLDYLVKAKFAEMFEENKYPVLKWNDVFETTTGKLDSNAMDENGLYPFFTCSKTPLRINSYAFDQEALLLAGNNAVGKYDVKHYSGKFNAYQRTYVLTLKNNWSYELFKCQLENQLDYLQNHSLGGLTKYLTLKILSELKFTIPPLPLQEQFAEYVQKTDRAKAAVKKTLEKAQVLKAALMQKYFG